MSVKLSHQVAEGFRLSPQQKRIWRLYESHPFAEFGCQCRVLIKGPLDAAQLDKAIARVGGRQEILRTKFAFLAGTSVPVQVVNESAAGLNEVALLCRAQEAQREQKIQRIARKHWERLRELGHAPAFHFALATVSECEHVLVITASGLCGDSATLANLIDLVKSAYFEQDATEPSEVLQYADLSEWQNQLLENSDPDQSPYWRSAEFSELAFPRLPFELQRTKEISGFMSETLRRTVPAATATALMELAERLKSPLQAVLLSAWQMVLHRVSSMNHFVVGAGFDGRVQPELRSTLGLFGKFLPLAASFSSNPQWEELLRHVTVSLEMAHCDQLLFDFEPFGIPDPSQRRRLFPVLFAYRESPPIETAGPLSWEVQSFHERLEPFELALTANSAGNSLQLEFGWETAIFAQPDVELLAEAYLSLLDEIARDPEQRVADFNMVAPGIPGSVVAVPAAKGQPWSAIHEIIEGHARRIPNEMAVVCENDRITYGELDRRASVLAVHLEKAGATSDSVVALSAERSVDFIVGILAALKAGAAWLPIEPDTPPARIQYMVQQTSAVALLTQRALFQVVSAVDRPVVYLDEHVPEQTAIQPPMERRVHPSQRAYVIFTSGSTGQPKGVAIEHRQIMAYVRGLADRVDLGACDNFAVVSTLAADLGHTAVFGALSSGKCLHVISASRALNAEALGQYFLEHSVDFLKIVPSHLEVLCRSFPQSARLPWRYLLVGGELLTWRLVEMAQHFAPQCNILNHYGPTETTVGVFCGPAKSELRRFQGAGVPLGRPFAGVTAYLLDEQYSPVPVWMPGELYIGGDSVGRGYVGRGGLTADRFVPDPFACKPGARMYRTGDLARYRSDGTMEFLGRRDGQVKIRGYRVELGEIEAALCRHPEVQKAAVIVADDNAVGKNLVAWVAIGSARIVENDLRGFLQQSLPSYMVPSAIVCVDQLKLTSNGKIDRQALLRSTPTPAAVEFRGHGDEVEESLVAIWRSVLGVERVGVEDNYFSLGGDSLRVIQLVHEAQRYGIVITAADILRYPTIRQLRRAMQAESLRSLFPEGVPALTPPLETLSPAAPADVIDFYPLSGMQAFMVKNNRPGIFHIQDCFHISDASFSYPALESALQAAMERHPALRTVFDLESSQPMQWVRGSLPCAMNLENISHLEASAQEEHIAAALRADCARQFDLSDREAPLFRVMVFQKSASEFNLVFSCHHAIMDGWGHRVLLNHLVQAYLSCKAGAKPDLGKPDNTCREFVTFQEAVRQSEKAAAFWRQYLEGADPQPLTPADGGSREPLENASLLRPLTPELAQSLLRAARINAVSMQALALSAWFEVLRKISGRELVVAGVVANGRSEHLSNPLSTVGLFWNIVPMVSRMSLPSPAQAVAVQKDLVDAEPYLAYPMTQLQADQGGRELFFSTFRYLNFWNTQPFPKHSDLRLVSVRSHDRYSFPLNCSIVVDPASNGGYLQLDYDPDMLDTGRIHAALNHYYQLLEQIASDQAA